MLGLFAFFYGTLHFLTWLVLDQFFDWEFILADIAKRPYITVGFTAFVLLIPLALTSTTGWIRRLGGRWWNRLHRLVYATAVARGDPLPVAGQGRRGRADHVCGDRGRAPRPPGLVGHHEAGVGGDGFGSPASSSLNHLSFPASVGMS